MDLGHHSVCLEPSVYCAEFYVPLSCRDIPWFDLRGHGIDLGCLVHKKALGSDTGQTRPTAYGQVWWSSVVC